MKIFLIACILALVPFAANAEGGVIDLPGNTTVITGYDGAYAYSGPQINAPRTYYNPYNNSYYAPGPYSPYAPNAAPAFMNEFAMICGNTDSEGERNNCFNDILSPQNDRAELYRKYNN